MPRAGPTHSAYVSACFNFLRYTNAFGGGPVLCRASAGDAASDGVFIGDWLVGGGLTISFWLLHDAPAAVTPRAPAFPARWRYPT